MTARFTKIAVLSLGTALALMAMSSAVLAKPRTGASVLQCKDVQVTDCTQTSPNGPATCTFKIERVCTVVSGPGAAKGD